ncbi:MAG: hypothetical protein J6U54_04775 [Clostridiales bacterium]|nr:hypothetical protein [Clostridiales bacterium]
MGMKEMPLIKELGEGRKFWENDFGPFKAKVLVETPNKLEGVVNFGYKAPYLLVFSEKDLTQEEAVNFSDSMGFSKIARDYSSSVVFIYPENGWDDAPESLFRDVIANSRIHQYYKDGVVTSKDRFTGQWGDCFIRGAIFRTCVYGRGKAADHIARYLLKTYEGEFLWGPGEITPASVVLENLSVMPDIGRRDIPVVSVGNSDEINAYLKKQCDDVLIKSELNFENDFYSFLVKFKRWCGNQEINPDLNSMNLIEEPGYVEVKTSPDNCGDDKDTTSHKIGYVAYYRKGLLDNPKVPFLLVFHGGGDSAFYIMYESRWVDVASQNDVLIVSVENHLNSTATETIELLEDLKKIYPVDGSRVYASGFSMGGCKCWDLYQEYPQYFAALAPNDATFEVGDNVYGKKAPVEINKNVSVPIFYTGGEITPLPELPFQEHKCWDRTRYVFEVNRLKTPYNVTFEDQSSWKNKIWGIDGDKIEKIEDKSRDSVLTLNYFENEDGVYSTVFGSISGQGHECRAHTCAQAWKFISQFSRK